MSSAELAQRVVKVKTISKIVADKTLFFYYFIFFFLLLLTEDILFFNYYFSENIRLNISFEADDSHEMSSLIFSEKCKKFLSK